MARENQTPRSFKKRVTHEIALNYLAYLPPDYNPKKRWPLMLFLHGAGERGTNIWLVAKHGPPKIARTNASLPFILISPQCPAGDHWSNDLLLALLDHVTGKYAVDTNRIYLSGLSMGGYGTWALAIEQPEKFAAIAPICGGGETISILLAQGARRNALKRLPVWAFHGAKDPVVPLEESQRMVDALEKIGNKHIELTIYPEATHDSWTETYNNPKLYEWLLSHKSRAPAR
ncbi:MAG: prolyl oligopeptidase family serine peptidase [Verrucomicrobia subdivision 3 bacterium]|nr:prolyl oligopeptidase family serine peptidase [Limisphaerales bacterium]